MNSYRVAMRHEATSVSQMVVSTAPSWQKKDVGRRTHDGANFTGAVASRR